MGSLRSLRSGSCSGHKFQSSFVKRPDSNQLGLQLFSACVREEWREAAALLHKGADPNLVNSASPSATILDLAVDGNATTKFIKLLLDKGADVNKSPEALLITCVEHQSGTMELLLKAGADPNVRDANG